MRIFPPVDISPSASSLGRLLGLVEDDSEQIAGAVSANMRQVHAIWPFAMGAHVMACVALATAIVVYGLQAFGAPIVDTVVLSFASLAVAAMKVVPAAAALDIQVRCRILAIAALVIAAALSSLLWIAAALPDGSVQLGCIVAGAGAIGITAVTFQPVRAATLGFGAGLVGALGLHIGLSLPTFVAIVFFTGLVVATTRLARIDYAALLARAAEAGEGRLAAKMIAEYEGHGTGWFWEADRHGRITYLSAKVATEIAQSDAPPIGRKLTDVFRMDSDASGTERTLGFHISSRTSFSDYSVRAAGDVAADRWWSISGRPVIDDLGRFGGFIGSGSDLTEKRRSDAEITRLALFDGLTGLANRQRMRLSLEKTLAQGAGPYRPSSLFLLDLDRFKAVNDTLGHQAGDALLKQVAQRVQRVVGEAGLVGRVGGDEFQVLLPGMDAPEPLAVLSRDIITSLSQPYFIAGTSVTIGCSIGIAIAPQHGEDSETLIRNADLALYAAKADGRGVHRFYSNEMLAGAQSRKQLEDDLRHAFATGAFNLAYQPVVSTRDARIVGYEALIRWNHPTRGAVSPAEFVPVAEDCGMIEAIGEWVLRTACLEAARWPGHVRVAVNVSPIQFANPALPGLVANALARSGIAPARLELEITEGVFLDESTSSDQMFRSLKALGVRLALDDFGTGYSSLGYLRTAPFDKIKIDQSFVRGAAQAGNRNAAIIKAIVTLADTLGMETTAEGVEIQDEIELVRTLGCSHIQGYVYGKPASAQDVRAQLSADEGIATARGFKVSRSPRTKVLRNARIAIDGAEGDVRIRDISSTGAMIDGIDIEGESVGIDLLIELVENQMFAAQIRWAEDGRAGVQFAEHFNLERFNQTPTARTLRRTG